jgi:hypothetical protein
MCEKKRYCNVVCQKAHWKAEHKLKCGKEEEKKEEEEEEEEASSVDDLD